ncbi:unnamed protein product [Symbiodinium natans]|uniref:RING-type domain-containing protein n=1 Tax=Symbiodinium natans TaxID=878477 RepID=A0A812LU62_9DINO|nr:unnamed protein product [Symbiodinium natans]
MSAVCRAVAELDPLRAMVTLALAIGLWFGLHRWCKNHSAKTKLASAVDAGNPDEMLKACDEVEASGADATGVPAVRHMASVLRRCATLREPDGIEKACGDAEAAGVDEQHVQAFRQKACMIRRALRRLAAAVDAGNPDEMLKACDEVEASGADATGVPAVRHMASVLRRCATLREPDRIEKACGDAEAAGVDEQHVQAFRQKACMIRRVLRRLAAAVDVGNPDEMLKACDEVEASGADATGVPAVRLKAKIILAEDEVNVQLSAVRCSLEDLQAKFAAEDSLRLLTLLAATLTALQGKLTVACKCVSCHEAVLAGQAPVCSQGTHSLCSLCFEKYARAEQDQPEAVIRQRGAFLECPCRAPADARCKGSFSEQTMAKYLPSELFDTHMGLQRQQIRAEEHAKANQMLNKLAAEWERQVPGLSQELLANQLKAALPGAHQCGRCGFGPVLHDRCDNLSTHHNESSGRTRISNACPSCGHFSGNISGWPRWDGRVRHLAQARSTEVPASTNTKTAASSSDSRRREEQIRRDYELAVRLSRVA